MVWKQRWLAASAEAAVVTAAKGVGQHAGVGLEVPSQVHTTVRVFETFSVSGMGYSLL